MYEVYGAISECGDLPDIPVDLPENIAQMTKSSVNKYALKIANYDSAMRALGEKWYKNPWQGITVSYLNGNKKNELKNALEHALIIEDALEGIKLYSNNLADMVSIANIDDYWSIAQKYYGCFGVPKSWYERSLNNEEGLLNELKATSEQMAKIDKQITEKFTAGIYELDGKKNLSELNNAMQWLIDNIFGSINREDMFSGNVLNGEQFDVASSKMALLKSYYKDICETLDCDNPENLVELRKLIELCSLINKKNSITDEEIERIQKSIGKY